MKNIISKVLLASGVAMAVLASPIAMAGSVAAPDYKRGEKLFNEGDLERGVVPCFSCHGQKGNSPLAMYPHLAGQHASYIVASLKNFKVPEGQTDSNRLGAADGTPSLMAPNVLALTEQDMQDIAYYVSKQALTEPAFAKLAANRDTVLRGRQIWRAGIPERNVPACASCHGVSGQGIPGSYPRLSGQHPEYLEAQLVAFAEGYRKNGGAENQMGTIANRMNSADIKAVADFAAGIR